LPSGLRGGGGGGHGVCPEGDQGTVRGDRQGGGGGRRACRRFWHKQKQQLAMLPLRRGQKRGRAKRSAGAGRAPALPQQAVFCGQRSAGTGEEGSGYAADAGLHTQLAQAHGAAGSVAPLAPPQMAALCSRRSEWTGEEEQTSSAAVTGLPTLLAQAHEAVSGCYGTPSSSATAGCFLRSAVSRDGQGGSSGENGCCRPADTAGAGSGGGWLGHPSGTATTSCSSNNTGFVSNSTVCRKTVIVVLLLA
jgi:hypothetical protein